MAVEEVRAYRTADGRCFADKAEAYKENRMALGAKLPVVRNQRLDQPKEFDKLVKEVGDWLAEAQLSQEVEQSEPDEAVARRVKG